MRSLEDSFRALCDVEATHPCCCTPRARAFCRHTAPSRSQKSLSRFVCWSKEEIDRVLWEFGIADGISMGPVLCPDVFGKPLERPPTFFDRRLLGSVKLDAYDGLCHSSVYHRLATRLERSDDARSQRCAAEEDSPPYVHRLFLFTSVTSSVSVDRRRLVLLY